MKHQKDYKQLEKALKEELFDQDFAVESLIKNLIQMNLLKSKYCTKALFTFIGPPNSGKHYLPQLLLQEDSDIEQLKVFYMDNYSGSFNFNAEQLSAIETDIVEFIQKHPNSILLFEDIEKADFQTQLTLYTLFSAKQGKSDIDFSNTIVIITTSRLSSLVQRKDIQKLLKDDPLQAHTFLMEKLSREKIVQNESKEDAFDKKFLSFLNEHTLIAFNKLSLTALIKIGARALHKMSQTFIKHSSVEIEYIEIESFVSLLTLSLSPYLNAKYIKQKLPEIIFDHFYEALKLKEDVKHIRYKVSKKAQLFINEALKDEHVLINKLRKQHFRISLDWSLHVEDETVECLLKDASYVKEKLSITSENVLHVSNTSFDDIIGHKKVKEELSEVVALLKEPERLQHFSMPPPKGMFLYGPSGMGKKLLARAFANAADMPYTVINNSDLFNEAKIHKAYAQAYSAAPAIVILENIDIKGIVGGIISTMSVSPLIDELDSLNQNFEAPVFTIATLSEVNNIPESLMKTGRMDIRIEVPKLDMEARRFFIEEVLKKPHDKNIDVERVVRYISGMGGNDLKRIGQEASLFAARKGLKKLTEEILLEQINIIKYGTKLENRKIRDIETSMKKTAYHEAGHAVLSSILLPKTKIEQVTVAPRSEALGFVSYHHDDFIDATSKKELFNNICVLLAGRVAKMEKFGEDGMETGAINDLEIASLQAYAAIAMFGMDSELGYINIGGIEEGYEKELLVEKIEERLLVWIKEAKEKTEEEVKRLWPAIESVAKELIKKEMIDGEELKMIIKTNSHLIKK